MYGLQHYELSDLSPPPIKSTNKSAKITPFIQTWYGIATLNFVNPRLFWFSSTHFKGHFRKN